ncbi:HEAT repeat domain-containing protein [Pedobacter nanyangensis]|uniref:HEAT repeat domain-containing protein n=1 Tax=Pedobacter nanyangensis TaxID=1562389 RepID=UPI000DE1E63A|nr:HEAT repeat domain-containing protein [Pedobacter nanyangensis]
MEHDFFKRYVQEHKEAFEDQALPPNMLGNILGNMRERQLIQERRKRKLTYTWMAVAASMLIFAGSYLFLSQETTVTTPPRQIASNNKNKVEAPVALPTEIVSAKTAVNTEKPKRLVAYQPNKEIYSGLADSLSVASRLNAILKAGSLPTLDQKLKTVLSKVFNEDENDNVRLAALEVLSKFAADKYIQQQLTAGLTKQKDPVIQLELIKVLGNSNNPETTDKLIAMADNPLTMDVVKDQVHYALLTKQQLQ